MKHIVSRRMLFMVLFVVVATIAGLAYHTMSEQFMGPTYRADRLFKPYGDEIHQIAKRVERGQSISIAQIKALPGGVNARYGEEITLLFHALGARNVEAIDTLLEAGADPYMIDTPSKGSERAFIYYLTLPGDAVDPIKGFRFINQLIALYLKHGGDPNRRLGGQNKNPLIEGVALINNYEGVNLLLNAGADPWAEGDDGDTAMTTLARSHMAQKQIEELIKNGYFNDVPLIKLQKFMQALSSYLPRGDEISRVNQKLGRRILKRHPNYPADRHTERLFQGSIPWAEIKNER